MSSALGILLAWRARALLNACAFLVASPLAAQPILATFGGTANETGRSVALDAHGGAVVTGSFQGTVDFDPGPGATTLTSEGNSDVFVARYSPTGTFVSAIRIGGPGIDDGRAVAVDADGNAVVTGSFQGTVDFDPGAGVLTLTGQGNYEMFVARYTPGGALLSAIAIGGPGEDEGLGVAVDDSGNAVVTGDFSGTVDFDPGAGMTTLTSAGWADAFVARYTPSGTLLSALRFGGTGNDVGFGVALDASGNAVVTGRFWSTVDFDPGPAALSLTSAGDYDVFVARYTASGEIVSAIRFGDTNLDCGYGVAVDASGNAVVTGYFYGTVDFDPGIGTTILATEKKLNPFVARYTPSGALLSAISLVSASNGGGNAVALDASGHAVVTGYFQGTMDVDPGTGTVTLTSEGGFDGFVVRYTPSGELISALRLGSEANDVGFGVAINASGNAVVTGYFQGMVDFDPGDRVTRRTSAGGADGFVAWYTLQGGLLDGMSLAADGDASRAVVSDVRVSSMAPNPARGASQVHIEVAVPQHVTVGVYDAQGRRLVEVFAGAVSASETVAVETSALPVGVYVVIVKGERSAVTRTLVVAR